MSMQVDRLLGRRRVGWRCTPRNRADSTSPATMSTKKSGKWRKGTKVVFTKLFLCQSSQITGGDFTESCKWQKKLKVVIINYYIGFCNFFTSILTVPKYFSYFPDSDKYFSKFFSRIQEDSSAFLEHHVREYLRRRWCTQTGITRLNSYEDGAPIQVS